MTKKDFVLIMGLGLNQGQVGAAAYFAKKGRRVVVTDLKTKQELKESVKPLAKFDNIEFVFGKHRKQDFAQASLIIVSPAITPDNQFVQIAKDNNRPIFSPVSYFMTHKKGKVIGITGTRGKSTTTNLIYQILAAGGEEVFLGGNIGISVFDFLDQLTEESISVLEISNHMLEWTRQKQVSPDIALITNVMADHISRHGSMAEYIKVKQAIFEFQTNDNLLILNPYNPITASFEKKARAKVILPKFKDFKFINNLDFDDFHPLAGKHNQENILMAASLAQEFKISKNLIIKAIKNYSGLYGRQMYKGRIRGIDVINDTCATMPEAVIAALSRFSKKSLILLTGGKDKGLSYQAVAAKISQVRPKAVVVLAGSASEKLKKEVEKLNLAGARFYWNFKNLKTAVTKCFDLAQKGDLILFSPGGSSFEMFANEFDRGEQFDAIINSFSHK